jgi:hypothetical protein
LRMEMSCCDNKRKWHAKIDNRGTLDIYVGTSTAHWYTILSYARICAPWICRADLIYTRYLGATNYSSYDCNCEYH